MPSGEHESAIALARLDPGVGAWLLANVFGIAMPGYHHAREQPAEVRVLVPRTYKADNMVVYCDRDENSLLAAVWEIQRGWDEAKRRRWPLYVAQLEDELDTDAALLVYCPDPVLAGRYRGMFDDRGLSLRLRPFIFTPADVPFVRDAALARGNPALAVLSAICHGGHPQADALFPALAEALRSADPDKAILYYDVVLAGLPPPARTRWEAFMKVTKDYPFVSERLRTMMADSKAEGEAKGEARGEAEAVLKVLEARSVTVPDDVREQIRACTDSARLDTWLRRAVTAVTVADVIGGN